MQVNINSTEKLIKIDENVNAKELFEFIEKLLPEGGPLGSWKEYKIQAKEVVFNNWTFPIVSPTYPTAPLQPYWQVDTPTPIIKRWDITCGVETKPGTVSMEYVVNSPLYHGSSFTSASGSTETLN